MSARSDPCASSMTVSSAGLIPSIVLPRVDAWTASPRGSPGAVNGPPASGRSTLARRYVADHPLALALDIDTVRGMLGGGLDQPMEACAAARRLALAMASAHLRSGHEVLVPQFLGRLDLITALDAVAAEMGVPFLEMALLSSPDDAAARFVRRSARPQAQEHRDAAAVQERSGGTKALPDMYERLLSVITARPATRVRRQDRAIFGMRSVAPIVERWARKGRGRPGGWRGVSRRSLATIGGSPR